MSIDISQVVRATGTILSGGAASGEFGRGLLLTKDTTLDGGGGGKVGVYASQSALESVFAANSEPRKAGAAWFAQTPYPKPLMVGRQNDAAVNTSVVGGTPDPASDIDEVSNGSFRFGGKEYTGLDFSSASSYTAQAAVLQTKLRADTSAGDTFHNALVSYANGRFLVTLAGPQAIGEGGLMTAADAGTFVGGMLGLSAAAGARYKRGGPQETVAAALSAIAAVNGDFYFVLLDASEAGQDSGKEVSEWCQANGRMAVVVSDADETLAGGDTESLAAELYAEQRSRTVCCYDGAAESYLHVSIAARMSAVDFDQANSLITAKFKNCPGIAASEITQTQKEELDRKRCNYYTRFGARAFFAEGVTTDPAAWIDSQYWLDWVVGKIQSEVLNLLSAAKKVPQASAGMAALRNTVNGVMEIGVRNGGIAPGVVSELMASDIRASTGNQSFDGNLTRGYLTWVGALDKQNQTDRAARKSPPIKVWMKGSGALHSANISLVFED